MLSESSHAAGLRPLQRVARGVTLTAADGEGLDTPFAGIYTAEGAEVVLAGAITRYLPGDAD